jgi:hypothetical protein
MLYQEINEADFISAFKSIRPENFSYEGLKSLYGYFEELSDDQNIEFDVIAICCDFTEYDSLAEFNRDYGQNFSDVEEIFDHTQVIMIDNEKFIIQNY